MSRQDAEISERIRRIRRSLKTGKRYAKYSQDLQFARNPQLVSTHPNKTRQRLEKTAQKAAKEAELAAAAMLAKKTISDQAKLELELFDSAAPLIEELPLSRENPSEDGYNLRYLKPFIGHLIAQNVSRSGVQKAPSFALSVSAQVIAWATQDPEFSDPKNPLRHLVNAGWFSIGRGDLSEKEAIWIDRATVFDPREVAHEIDRLFGMALPPDYPLSNAVLMGMARIAQASDMMSQIDPDLIRKAYGMVESSEVAFVQQTLGLEEAARDKAEAVVSFLKHRVDHSAIENFEISVSFGLIRMLIDDLDPAGNEPDDWVPSFCEKIQVLAQQLAPIVRSEEVFFALISAAQSQSLAKRKFAELDAAVRASDRSERNHDSIETALASGLSFKFRSDGLAITEDDPEFHLIAQTPLTRDTYMGSSRPAFDPAENDDHGSSIVDAVIPEAADDDPPGELSSPYIGAVEQGQDQDGPPLTDVTPGNVSENPDDDGSSPNVSDAVDAGTKRPTEPDYTPAPITQSGSDALVEHEPRQLTVLPPLQRQNFKDSQQKSLFDIDDKDVI